MKCVVCKSLFCCLECRQRHEQNAHSEQEVLAERERMNCGFCNGHRAVEFDKRNDFAFILHICQFHLPLHCKKCFTVSNFDASQISQIFENISSSFFFFIFSIVRQINKYTAIQLDR